MLQNRSVATIDSPEFINITPYNPLISECEIKVFYLGENRNHSVITKDVAIQMANSLPGTPIVGAWKREVDDFGTHGHSIKIEDGEVKFSCKTVPYGFVAPDAKVWFQKFTDIDKNGIETEREYLMTTGYLWTGQYSEVKKALLEGQPQSMELDEETLGGHWATNDNSGIDFFIINDALFSKLCILGDNVEPCFEGASVTSPDVSKNFAKDEDFARTLFTMMNELKDALSKNKGGLNMPNEETLFEAEKGVGTDMPKDTVDEEVRKGFKIAEPTNKPNEPVNTKNLTEAKIAEPTNQPNEPVNTKDITEAKIAEPVNKPNEPVNTKNLTEAQAEEYVSKKNSEEETSEDEEYAREDKMAECSVCGNPKAQCVCGKPNGKCACGKPNGECACGGKKTYTAEEYEALEQELDSLKAELAELNEFKLAVESKQKDDLINRYHMLSDEAKQDIIEHKNEYSLNEIESKLAVLYVANFADFSTVDGKNQKSTEDVEESDPITTFSLDTETTEIVPAFVEALRQNRR